MGFVRDDRGSVGAEHAVDFSVSVLTVGGRRVAVLSVGLATLLDVEGLTAAERQVALELMLGRTNSEIASLRGTSVRTVANQAASAFRKLGVYSRSELAAVLLRAT